MKTLATVQIFFDRIVSKYADEKFGTGFLRRAVKFANNSRTGPETVSEMARTVLNVTRCRWDLKSCPANTHK